MVTPSKTLLRKKGIKRIENKIEKFVGKNGQTEQIIFENGESVLRRGGLLLTLVISLHLSLGNVDSKFRNFLFHEFTENFTHIRPWNIK
jgi:hypothetical protein